LLFVTERAGDADFADQAKLPQPPEAEDAEGDERKDVDGAHRGEAGDK
jgi:hypothetical protein